MSAKEFFSHQPNLSKLMLPNPSVQPFAKERLLKRLHKAAEKKYVLVQAPQGYGKTLLLSEWFRIEVSPGDEQRCGIWFKVDESDGDPAIFWSNLITALEHCWPGIHDEIAKSAELFEQFTIHEQLITIANHITQTAADNTRYYLVMVNFETFRFSESETQLFVFSGMLPSNIHVVISSRAYLNNHLVHQNAYNELAIIGINELSFTKKELAAYMGEQLGKPLDPTSLDKLFRKTEGWPFAVNVLLQSAQTGTDIATAIEEFSGTERFISEFVFKKAIEGLPPRITSFIIETAYLQDFCGSLCNFVTQTKDSADIIRYLERNGLFTYAIDKSQTWFRYHPLFAQWLQSQALELRRDTLRSLNHRAGQWYRNEKMPLLSTRYVIAATDDVFVLNMSKFVFEDLPRDYAQLLPWLFSLDSDNIEHGPRFCLSAAWAYTFLGRANDALYWSKRTVEALDVSGRPAPDAIDDLHEQRLALVVRSIEVKCHVFKGNNEKSIGLCSQLIEELNPLTDDLLRMVLLQSLAEAYDQSGDFEKAKKFYVKAMTLARANHFDFLTGLTRYQTVVMLYRQGQLSKAEELCRSTIAECPQDFSVYGALYGLLSLVKIEQNRLEETNAMMQRAFKRVSADRNIDIFLDVCVAYSQYFVAKGSYADAQLQLTLAREELRKYNDVPPRGVSYRVFTQQARIYLIQGDTESAQEALDEYEILGFPTTATGELAIAIERARIALMRADEAGLDEVAQLLSACIASSERLGLELLRVESLILAAVTSYRLHMGTAANRFIKDALSIAGTEQLIRRFVEEGEVVRALLMELLSSGHAGYTNERFIRKLLRAFEENEDGFGNDAAPNGSQVTVTKSQVIKSERLANLWNLTSREQEVLLMLKEGFNRKDIAVRFCTSQNTVKTHISHLYEKIDVHSVPELLRTLMENDVL
ncbi:MAG: LuxR C-terminal-related transcriptional regulator [Coriobacteriales bacterium]|jgi:LuxR family maltose regulon positive regulatory protein|nr:LuxR C-terminal-related transcriptional regulator [Coriobacteriales bacterium]